MKFKYPSVQTIHTSSGSSVGRFTSVFIAMADDIMGNQSKDWALEIDGRTVTLWFKRLRDRKRFEECCDDLKAYLHTRRLATQHPANVLDEEASACVH